MKKLFAIVAALAAVAGCGGGSSQPTNAAVHQNKTFQYQVRHPKLPTDAYTRPGALQATSNIHGEDNVDVFRIPLGTPAIGCYSYGPYRQSCVDAASRFPNSYRLSITPSELGTARILDVEPGDAVPSQAGSWARRMVSQGVFRPGVYSTSWNRAAIVSSLSANGLTHCTAGSTSKTCYVLWLAAWDNNPSIPVGWDSHQYAGGNVRDYDTFASYVFKASAPPVPLCSRTMCYSKFSIFIWHNPNGIYCKHGCSQRQYMYAWQHAVHKSHRIRLAIRYRLQALQHHADYQIQHGHNTAANRKVAHVLWAAGYRAAWRSNFNAYLKVNG